MKISGAGLAAAAAVPLNAAEALAQAPDANAGDWEKVRGLFSLSDDTVHMSAMLISAHPRPVREAVAEYRRELDANPVAYLEENGERLTEASRMAAGNYLGIHHSHVALTDSTTMGVGLVYTGLKLQPGDEVLTTTEDYYVTHESLRVAAERTGATVRRVRLFDSIETVSADEIVSRIVSEVTPATRVVAVTWVHSSTGLKIPVAQIAAALGDINAERDEEDQVLLGVDGVHGFGVEDTGFLELGCDFLMAGCHKWLFGPRGTGIAAISGRGLARVRPTIPSFTDQGVFTAWLRGLEELPGSNDGPRMTPGGFKAFEHRWALARAFDLHEQLGRTRVAERTRDLASLLKHGLSRIPAVRVLTPTAAGLSAGIVSFDVDGWSPGGAVSALRERRIVASVAPYAEPHVRLTPSIRNNEAEIERTIDAIREIA